MNIIKYFILPLFTLFAVFPVSNTLAQERAKIAILGLEAKMVEKEIADIISDTIAVEISNLGNIEVITKSDIKAMLDLEAQKQMLGCEDDVSCLVEIGGALGVDKIVTGSLGKIGEIYVINLSLVNVKMAFVENRVSEKVRGDVSILMDRLSAVVSNLLGKGREPVAMVTKRVESGVGDIFVTASEKGSKVYLDGEYRGISPLTITEVKAGDHTIKVEKGNLVGMESVYLGSDEIKKIKIEMSMKMGGIKVYSDPPEAIVFLDGKEVGKSPLSLKEIEAGSHKIVVKKEGLMPYEKIVIVKDEVVTVNASLENLGILVVEGYPEGASVSLDGVLMGNAPFKGHAKPKRCKLKVEKSGYFPYEKSLEIKGGEESKIEFKLEVDHGYLKAKKTRRSVHKVITWSSLAIGGIGLAGGLYFYNSAEKAYDEYKNATDQDAINNHWKNVENNDKLKKISIGVGIAGAVVSLISLVTMPSYPEGVNVTQGFRPEPHRTVVQVFRPAKERRPEGLHYIFNNDIDYSPKFFISPTPGGVVTVMRWEW